MNKKGFTLVELLAVILILGLLIGITTGIYNSYLSSSRYKTFNLNEKSFVNAVKEAYLDCESNHPNNVFCKEHKQGEDDTIYLKDLVDDDYIDAIKNPYNTDELCNLDKSYVTVTNNSNNTNSINFDISYKVCLICGEHISETCK